MHYKVRHKKAQNKIRILPVALFELFFKLLELFLQACHFGAESVDLFFEIGASRWNRSRSAFAFRESFEIDLA